MPVHLSAPLIPVADAVADRWRPWESRAVVGVANVDMTPPVGIRAHSWGAARTQTATGSHHALTSSILSIKDGDRWREIVTLDLCVWGGSSNFDRVVPEILHRVGSDRDHLLVHLVHTHSGPTLEAEGSGLEGAALLPGYRAALIDSVVNGIEQARMSATDSVVTWAYGSCALAVNRDLACADRDLVGFNPQVPGDSTLLVGRVCTAEGTLRAVVVNYACHPTTLAFENSLASADYIAATRMTVQEATGAPCVFLQGASGDLAPRDQYLPGTDLADRNGRALGYAVLSTVETMGGPGTELQLSGVVESGAPLAIWQEEPRTVPDTVAYERFAVRLELTPELTAEQLAQHWSGIDPVAAAERVARAARQAAGYDEGGFALHEVAVWRIGDVVIVAHPGEAYSLLQTELRSRYPDRAVVVMNLTNGPVSMYLPTREAYERDRYQVWQTRLEAGSLEKLIDAVDDRIGAMLP